MFVAFNSIKLPPLPTTISTKKKIKNINVQKLSKIFRCSDSDIESVSLDDEIYLNQLIEPVMNDCRLEDQVKNDNVIQDVIQNLDDDVELEVEVPTADVIMDDNNDDGVESVDHHIVVVNKMDDPPEQQQWRDRKRRSI